MMEPDDNSRDELQKRFREDLSRPLAERYYSEEELLSVFDVAGDNYDDYIRAEVLMLGMRLYPESEELLARRAIFYRDTDQASFQSFLKDNASLPHTELLDIMNLSNLSLDKDMALHEVEEFVASHRLDEDEEVIQFVQAVHSLGLDKWLVDNLDRIKAKVSYLPTLLYEIAILSDESEEFSSIAISVLEELTEIEPYSPEYWILLSLVYSRQNRNEEAENAVEYALAIEPDNVEALKAKLRSLAIKPDDPQVDKLLDRIGELDPEDADFAYIRLARAEEVGDNDKILSLLSGFSPAVCASRPVFIKAIEYGYDDMDKMASDLYDAGVTDETDWNELIEFAFENDNIAALTALLKVYERKTGKQLDHSFIDFRMLYQMGKYDVALALFTDNEAGGSIRNPDNLMVCYSMYVMCLLRTGHGKEAENACDTMLSMIDNEPMLPGTRLEKFGMKTFLEDVKKKLKSVRKTSWDKYDPLGLDRK